MIFNFYLSVQKEKLHISIVCNAVFFYGTIAKDLLY